MKIYYYSPFFLFLLGWLAQSHIPPWTAWQNEWPFFFASIFIIKFIKINWHNLTPNLFFIFILIISSSTTQIYSGDLLLIYGYGAGMLLFMQYGLSRGVGHKLFILAQITLASSLISSILIFRQLNSIDDFLNQFTTPLIDSSRAFANLAQPNNAATLLLMGWAGLSLLFNQGQCKRWAWWLGTLILFTGVVLTQSRTGILSTVAVCLLGALIAWSAPRASPHLRLADWLGALGVFAAITAAFQFTGSGSSIGAASMMAAGGRPVLWAQIWAGLMESPWVGYGWLQTSAAQQAGAMTVPGLEQTHYSHNLFLDLLVWNGIPLGLALIAGGLGWLWWSWRRKPVAERLWPLVFLLPLAVHSMLEMPFAYAYFLFPAAMVLGAWHAMGDPAPAHAAPSTTAPAQPTRPLRAAWWTLCAAYTALCALVAWEYTRVEEDFRIARFENMRIGQTPSDYVRPDFIVLTQLGDALAAMRLRAQPGMPSADIELLQRASRRYPWAPLHFRLTLALALNGQPEAARERLHLIHNLHGPDMHREAVANLRGLLPQYPQLAAVLDR